MLGRLEMKFGVQSVHSALLPMEYVQVKQRSGFWISFDTLLSILEVNLS